MILFNFLPLALVDGMGGEEVIQVSGAGLTTQSPFFTGSVTAGDQISGLNVFAAGSVQSDLVVGDVALSGLNAFLAGSVQADLVIGDVSLSGLDVFAVGSVQADKLIGDVEISGVDLFATGSVQANELIADENVTLAAGSPFGKGVVIQLGARSNISGGTFVSASGNEAFAAPANTLFPIGIAEPGTDVASGGTVNVITHGVAAVIAEATVAVGEGVIMGAGAALNTVVPTDTSSGLRVFGVLAAAGSEATVFITL